MADKNTDFLKFNAYSIKQLITEKLASDSRFTDQIYEGSNISLLINLVSYMYQCLTYLLNTSAAESLFQDVQLFENINRLVSLIGYQVKGCVPSAVKMYITNNDNDTHIILPYTRFNTGKIDSNGRKIYFSVPKRNSSDNEDLTIERNQTRKYTFVNGEYKMYPTIFTASGIGNETFILGGIKSDSESNDYVAQDYIDVFIEKNNSSENSRLEYWNYDSNGIFIKSRSLDNITQENSLYSNGSSNGNEDNVYTVYLNQDKQYELHFGDGIVGKKLDKGDRIIVMYLDTNGSQGEVDMTEIDFSNVKLEHNSQMFGMTYSENPPYGLYQRMFGVEDIIQSITKTNPIIQTDSLTSSSFKPEEDVDEIKLNAPNWFKTGNRLITKKDYEYFIKNNRTVQNHLFSTDGVSEVKCMNNIEYTSTFYKWLYVQGKKITNNGRYYLNQQFLNRYDYAFVDPADANNTYLWIKTKNSDISELVDQYDVGEVEDEMNKILKPIKTMTTEIKVVKPVYVDFDICAIPSNDDGHNESIIESLEEDREFDESNGSYIEITLDDNTLYVSTSIQTTIKNIILNTFNIDLCHFGQTIDFNSMLDKIYSIAGVKNVRTIFVKDGKLVRSYDGLSFASWSRILDDENYKGVDLNVSNSTRTLEPFQFPRFIGRRSLDSKIKLIKKSMTSINTIKM